MERSERGAGDVWKSVLRRVVLAAMTVLAGGLISATLVRYAPGFGSDERQLDARLSSASLAAIRDANASERRILPYYAGYIARALHGDLGISRSLNRPIQQILAERLSITSLLAVKALLVAWLAALSLVFAAGVLRLPALSLSSSIGSGVLLCIPAGALALLSVLLNAPGYLALAVVLFPKLNRYLSNLTAATVSMPHVLAARAKGLSETQILVWHVIPVIKGEVLALAGVSVGLAISAAIPVEALCGIPGIGQLAWQSALARDLPLLINLSMLVIAGVTLANSGADLLSADRGQAA
ncbi:MAG TPA: ABC transporter permease subunit [Terriglobales bacterium]|nr:ABC transporter permease subunit [Terriglobales bacterium]